MKKKYENEQAADTNEQDSCDGYLLVALQQLHAKLLAAQPEYMEDDVGVEYQFFSASPTHLSDTSFCEWGEGGGEHDESLWAAGDGVAAKQKRCGSAARLSQSRSSSTSQTTTVDLDKQITSYEFLLTVTNFEAVNLLRSRKVLMDVLKLVCHGYALTWKDTKCFPAAMFKTGTASSRLTAASRRDVGGRGNAATLATMRRSLLAYSASFLIPTHRPSQQLVRLMGRCVESLLVYANKSSLLRTLVTSNATFLRMLCFICGEGKKLESSLRDSGWRDIDEELNELVLHWQAFAVTMPFLDALKECYLVEFLLDVALPPAVCSSKFDAIATNILEKKGRLMVDMMSSRNGSEKMTKGLPLRGLAAFFSMSMFADLKLRTRLLDRMAGEGLVRTLLSELGDVLKEGMRLVRLADSAQLPAKKSRVSTSACRRSAGRKSAGSRLFSSPRFNQACSEKELLLGLKDSSLARRLGYCLEILQCLTAPDSSLEEGVSISTTKGMMRPTAWASHTDELQGICSCLLRLAPILRSGGTRCSFLQSFQDQAMNCVLQIASYSAVLYRTVVEVVNDVLYDYYLAQGSGEGDCASFLLPLLLGLLRLKQHAEANETCVRQWFVWLTECLVPQAFDVPLLTCNSTRNRRLCKKAGMKAFTQRREAPILARKLRRDEILLLSPYFYFSSRLILETSWRYGAEQFLARIALLAYNVLLTQARRPNLIFGQASLCYDVVAPLLETPCGVLPGEMTAAGCETFETPVRPACGAASGLSPSNKKRCRDVSHESVDSKEEVFIPSPSKSPVFLGAYSSSVFVEDSGKRLDGCSLRERSVSEDTPTSLSRPRPSISVFLAVVGEHLF